MKILIVDRDELAVNMVRPKLEEAGHEVYDNASKSDALELIANDHFDVLLIDPAPLTSPRPVIINIRRNIKHYPYIFLMSQQFSQEEAIKSGANDLLQKPMDIAALQGKIEDAERLTSLVKKISDESEDFPSAGGVIAKSAFKQLFLSALDRSDRYGEKGYVMFIGIDNFDEILQLDGTYAAEYAVAKLSQYLVRLRRQSDIIGQTARSEYALLLQRPLYETEPIEAAERFAEALQASTDIVSSGSASVQLYIELVEVPVGRVLAGQKISYEEE